MIGDDSHRQSSPYLQIETGRTMNHHTAAIHA